MKICLRSNKVNLIMLLIVILSSIGYAQYQTYTSNRVTDYFLNPVFTEDHPDPSILHDNLRYNVVQLSFEYYYSTITEGGAAERSTSYIIIFSRSWYPFGPWENSLHNPIKTLRSCNEI